MLMMSNFKTGTITKTFYGKEGHDILTFYLTLEYDGGVSQGFGGLALDVWKKEYNKRVDIGLGERIQKMLVKSFGVDSYESLVGQRIDVRFDAKDNYFPEAISPIDKNDWFDLKEIMEVFKDMYEL